MYLTVSLRTYQITLLSSILASYNHSVTLTELDFQVNKLKVFFRHLQSLWFLLAIIE